MVVFQSISITKDTLLFDDVSISEVEENKIMLFMEADAVILMSCRYNVFIYSSVLLARISYSNLYNQCYQPPIELIL